MAAMTPILAPKSLLLALLTNLGDTAVVIELLFLSGLFVTTWLGLRLLRKNLPPSDKPWLNASDWQGLLWPVVVLIGVLFGRALLANWQDVHLLNLSVPLLMSFLVIQLVFFLLHRVFQPSRKLHALRRSISWLVLGTLALHITGYLGAVIDMMDGIGLNVGTQRISLYTVLMGTLSLGISIVLALWLARTVETRLESLPLQANMRLALGKLVRTVLLILAVLIALPLVGIDITALSVFSGALGVGLGLALQKIAANYVSGITLLLDQSIRIGDMITVADRYGEVTKIATRYTVIRSLDGTETILPNDSLITSAVTNHSLSTPDNLVAIPIQVAYDSNLRQVESILLEIARQHPRVITRHEPVVRLTTFGDNGVELRLMVWIDHPDEGQAALISDLNWSIWEAFSQAGIEIPYPQRVVHVRSPAPPLPAVS